MKHNLNNLNLPKDARNSQLEIISKNHFRSLFDVDKFILKEETIDNGVDFRCEIKYNNKILGFGFNFQLKSTENIKKNQDKSFSKNIETSNIEYLLNNGQPAFYGFYVEEEKVIYFINLKKVIYELNLKDSNWQEQPNHTIRFYEKLNTNSVKKIFEIVLEEGQMLRKINAAFAEKYGNIDDQNKIIIDIEKNVFTDAEVTLYIEKYGLLLTDRCRWTEIIKLHNNSTIGKSTSPLYNLVLGISYYYCGEYFKALDYFKESYKKIDNLDSTLTEYLLFFYFSIQRILGIMNSKGYDDATQNFDENGSIKIYQKLESISDLISEMYVSEDYICADFEFRIKEIISNAQISNHLRLLAEIELVYYKSEQLICRLILLLEFRETNKVEENFNLINREYHSILNKTEVQNSLFINRYCMIRHSRFIIHFDCILRWRGVPSEFLNTLLPKILENIQISYAYFKEINHVENELYSLTVLLEYYQNLDLVNKISEINTIIKSYKAQYLNPDFNKKIDYTNASGTFVNQIINTKKNIDKKYSEMEKIKIKLEELDKVEKQSNYANYDAAFVVNLFPMGYFQFPEEKISCFF